MKNSDVIIIGGGLAGLMAAIVAAKRGKKVSLLTYGAGTLTVGGGIIDVLGYTDKGLPLASPAAGLEEVNIDHPYKKVGSTAVAEAISLFKQICEEEGFPYSGDLNQVQWVPTAAGTLKPTCLVPRTMEASRISQSEHITVIGFDYLKDFYPRLVAKNLANIYGRHKKINSSMVQLPFAEGRDVTNLDVARWLDTADGCRECIGQLKKIVKPGSTVIVPPVLGTRPEYAVLETMENALECRLVEVAGMPPSITGLRLRSMLVNYARKLGVKTIEKAAVTGAILKDGKCEAVITEGVDRSRTYRADSFILATGGLYGGGLNAGPGRVVEPIFNLPVEVAKEQEQWSNEQMFSNMKQPFAQIGIRVNERMRPLDTKGKVVLSNVLIAGRNLRGYDYCFEKSGNGVALASAYHAAMSL